MIVSFGNKLARDLVEENKSKDYKRFPSFLLRTAKRKLQIIHAARQISDLKVPPGNRLEKLKGSLQGCYSVRINDQWRVVFQYKNGNAENVKVEDYHS